MTNYGFGKDRVIDAGGLPVFRLVAIVVVGFFIVIFLFAAVAKVPSGCVGVLTLFGRVTGEVLPEGMHLVNPFKTNNVMSIRTEQVKESASVPSSEGLVMALDTSLLFHLNPGQAADLYQRIGPNYVDNPRRAQPARRHPRGYRVALSQRSLHRGTREGGAGDQHSAYPRVG